MARAIITFKIMPESPSVNLDPIKQKAQDIAKEHGALGSMLVDEQPIAFGLKAVILKAMYEVEGTDFEAIAAKIGTIPHVQSSEVASMDLALG